ncbi:MAG: hypothetical protein EWV91_07060 [Microcystis aeruginosa Ma_QC_Ca_00000000_S207]|uniref:Transglutaminase-like domain-containing protein n=1 Tax=Microcystis aeruginosa Ma_QC_Ca_00000000_S207 TaxID=2486251 RepID=A0A552FSW4_MICAE|nr:MAG: hypothetical protein EWV91_07060 [Microcystis aeruginosa Ma_QC_Ca_00000000_S207]
MEANRNGKIRSGAAYDYLFPRATLKDVTVKKGATVADTVKFIPKVVKMKRWQTKAYTDKELRGLSVYDACEKLWHFIYNHIAYKKDEEGLEQIRSPARAWHDRFRGVDCDCYTTFISTVLTNLGIPHVLRIAKYSEDYFQHIYPVVPMPDGSTIIIDCVVNEFNYEEPYTEIRDTKMDLQLLDGIEEPEDKANNLAGSEEVYGIQEDELGQLGWSITSAFKNLADKVGKGVSQGAKFVGNHIAAGAKSVAQAATKVGQFAAEKVGQGIHLLNKINPATILLRTGLLAALKLNMFNVSGRLRLSYLNKEEAARRQMNLGKHDSLISIRKKIESIFYAAGGEDSDLKNAILKGKGNEGRDKVLGGLNGIEEVNFEALKGMDENTPVYQLLGPELFYSNNVLSEKDLQGLMELEKSEGLAGINGASIADSYHVGQELTGLGEPVSVSIAAASGTLATIAGLINKLGNLYQTGKQVADNIKPVTDVAKTFIPTPKSNNTPKPAPVYAPQPIAPAAPNNPIVEQETIEAEQPATQQAMAQTIVPVAVNRSLPPQTQTAVIQATRAAAVANASNQTGFWDKHKKWLKPTLIGAGGLGVLYLGYRMITGNKAKPPTSTPFQGLSGLKGKKKPKRKAQKQAIELL